MLSIASHIDHTILKPTTSKAEVEEACALALTSGCAAVCVPPCWVNRARSLTEKSQVKVATVIGFPMGYLALEAKKTECTVAMEAGAVELDVVIHLAYLKEGFWNFLEKEMQDLLELAHSNHCIIKAILETAYLTREEIVRCCQLYGSLGVDYLKTSTGYAPQGATLENVRLMRGHLPAQTKIKASGGIRDYGFARQLLEAGADRLGCSATLAILSQEIEWAGAGGQKG